MLCFSRDWRSPVLWSHYGDKHQGICLGFDVPDVYLRPVAYVDDRRSLDSLVGDADDSVEPGALFHLKFKAWEYENEVRRIVKLKTVVHDGGHMYWPFGSRSGLDLREVVAGSRCSLSENRLRKRRELSSDVELIQVTCVQVVHV